MFSPAPVRVLLARIPDWSLLVARRQAGVGETTPVVVVSRGRVLACCPRARAEGVEPGLAVRAAQLRCPGAVVVDDDPRRACEVFGEVLEAVEEQVGPGIHVVRPGVLALQARGVARFHGGERKAAERLWQVLWSRGHRDATVGVADGLFTAELAARTDLAGAGPVVSTGAVRIVAAGDSPAFLAPLPVGALAERLADGQDGSGPDGLADRRGGRSRAATSLVADLLQLGLTTLGQFAAVDGGKVFSRFGEQGVVAHDLARGRDLSVLSPWRPGHEHLVEVVSEEPLALAEEVVELVRPGVEELMADLAAGGRVCAEARILVRSTGGASEHTWRQPWQFSSEDLLGRLVRQLGELPDAVPAAEGRGDGEELCQRGVEAVRIILTVHRAAEASEGLFGARPRAHLVHIVTRLQGRLGAGAVVVPTVVGGRLLKERRCLTPFGTAPASTGQPLDRPWPGHLEGPAPALVYDRPPAVRLEDEGGSPATEVDPQRPCWLRIGATRHRIIAWAGPWPVHQRWWRSRSTSVDRFQLVTEDQQAWLLATSRGRWWAEARYEAG